MKFNNLFGLTEAAISAGLFISIGLVTGGATSTTPTTPPSFALPQAAVISNSAIANDFADANSPGAIGVGVSEGTRTPDGGVTSAYEGHTDPGNAAPNVGSFSCQPGTCSSRTPREADAELLAKRLQPALAKAVIARPDLTRLEAWVYADMLVQAPLAGEAWLKDYKPSDRARGMDGIVDARVRAFSKPDGTLDAPGFDNDISRLRADQMRRTRALAATFISKGIK
jgi:hypothetical protein